MNKLVLNPEYKLYEKSGKPFCTSRQVAETFHKDHHNVIRDIRELDCSDGFRLLNFDEILLPNASRRKSPEVLMTKDGFTFLVMGYRGKKAAAFKEAYITRFNQMESFIKSLYAAKLEHPAFTEAVMLAHDEPKHYHFSNEADMINRIVLGVPAKQYRETHGIEGGKSIRPYLSTEEIQAIETLQRTDIGLLAMGLPYEQRKTTLTEYRLRRHKRLAA